MCVQQAAVLSSSAGQEMKRCSVCVGVKKSLQLLLSALSEREGGKRERCYGEKRAVSSNVISNIFFQVLLDGKCKVMLETVKCHLGIPKHPLHLSLKQQYCCTYYCSCDYYWEKNGNLFFFFYCVL